MSKNIISQEYNQLLTDLKQCVAASRYKAALSVNKELIFLYHHIGTSILKAQTEQGWGTKIISQLSKDLRSEFYEMKGFSPQNLKHMRKFAEEYSLDEIGQQPVDQLPWGHIITLIYEVLDKTERQFYIDKTIHSPKIVGPGICCLYKLKQAYSSVREKQLQISKPN